MPDANIELNNPIDFEEFDTQRSAEENAQATDFTTDIAVDFSKPVVAGNPAKRNNSKLYIGDRLLDSFVKNGVRYFKVKWKGFSDRTWDPPENIPDALIADYFSRKEKAKEKEE